MPWAFCIRREGETTPQVAHLFDEEAGALHYLQQQVLEYKQNDYIVEPVAGEPNTFLITDPQRIGEANHHIWVEHRDPV